MKTKILLPLAGIVLAAAFLISSTRTSAVLKPLTPDSQASFHQYPPYATRFWIQQLKTATANRENLIFKVQYESDDALPAQINVFNGSHIDIVLRDDGVLPDDVSGDKKYAAYKQQDASLLKKQIQVLETKLTAKASFPVFKGHNGTMVSSSAYIKFNAANFDLFKETEVNALLINATDCTTAIKKQNSLFITDLAIVEDYARTYNVKDNVGTPNGVWTFGTLMDNIENNTHADGLRGFLKDWVKQWTVNQTVNGQSVLSRNFVVDKMIGPWLKQSGVTTPVTAGNWETLWNGASEANLKKMAPFKLTAIVNRIDVRGNAGYAASFSNAGETRFIYTLIDPVTGLSPDNPNQTASQSVGHPGFVDWRGMNVILEYGNPQTDKCQLQAFAQQWLDLSTSTYSFGTPQTDNAYKVALQAITDQVTAANVVPLKINGSAINRIRSNEKVFATFDPNVDTHLNWDLQDWEFRQFELDATTHKLAMAPLTNTPPVNANYAPKIDQDYSTSSPTLNHLLIDWIYQHRISVLNGNFNIPAAQLAGASVVRKEETQYIGLDPVYQLSKRPGVYSVNTPSQEVRDLRQQISANSCVGCHAGNTKTVFTHVNTMGYGQSANYWSDVISGQTGMQDNAFYPNGGTDLLKLGGYNAGVTENASPSATSPGYNFSTAQEISHHNFFQSVSPFLTGRRQTKWDSGQPSTWQDDSIDDDASDNTLTGMFYVDDPSNDFENDMFPFLHNQKWGYNDLERRKMDLCLFLTTNCSSTNPNGVIDLISALSLRVLPFGGH